MVGEIAGVGLACHHTDREAAALGNPVEGGGVAGEQLAIHVETLRLAVEGGGEQAPRSHGQRSVGVVRPAPDVEPRVAVGVVREQVAFELLAENARLASRLSSREYPGFKRDCFAQVQTGAGTAVYPAGLTVKLQAVAGLILQPFGVVDDAVVAVARLVAPTAPWPSSKLQWATRPCSPAWRLPASRTASSAVTIMRRFMDETSRTMFAS